MRGIEASESEGPVEARAAATVILLRRGGRHNQRGLEILMLQRGADARFMPGVWVFAGGVVDQADREVEVPDDAGADADEWAHRVCCARELAEEANVDVGPEILLPWSRWITPEVIPLRFDTRFYVGLAPAHSKPEPDRKEMDDARWIAPQEALDAGARGELEISFPTVKHLEELAPFATADEVIAAAADRVVEPILPKPVGTPENFRIVLPGEPGYDD